MLSRPQKNRRVLIIDDNRAIHDDFRKILAPEASGVSALAASEEELFGSALSSTPIAPFAVDSAYQGAEGAQLVKAALAEGRPYAMAFVDVRMPPGLDGVETTLQLWELDPDLQVALCTAYADYSWGEILARVGDRDGLLILKKPFDAVEASQLAHALTEKWRLHKESRQKMAALADQVAARTLELRNSNDSLQREVSEHQRSERRLRESEGLLNRAQRIAHLGHWKRELATERLSWSDEVFRIFGVPADGFDGSYEAFQNRVHPDDRAQLQRAHAEVLSSHRPLHLEHRLIRPDGTIRWVREQAELELAPDGQPARFIGTVLDITDQRRAEQDLRESEERFRATFEQAAVGIAHVALDGRFLRVNDKLCAIAGYGREELLKLGFKDISLPEGLANAEEAVRSMLAGERPSFTAEKRYRRKSGDLFWANIVTTLLRESTGEPKYFVAVVEDISPRKQVESSLRDSEERFSGAFEHAPIGVALVSPEGRFLKVNRVLCELVGYSEGELLARTFQDITHPEDLGADLEKVRQLLAGEIHSYQMEKRYLHQLGGLVTVQLNVSLMRDGQGRPRYFISQIQDITERKRLEAQLLQSQKMETVGKLAGGVAHEFNSLMTAIIGQSELLLSDLPHGHRLTKNTLEIRQAAERAATLTRQLLAFGRKQILQPGILDLNAILARMESALRHIMGRSTDVLLVPAPGLWAVKADPGQIEQVILNMAMNAAEAMPNGGKLTLETANVTLDADYVQAFPELKAGEFAMLAITDTGAGMSAEVKARVFEPFYSTKGAGHGAGLGLSTCDGIIRQSGGHLALYSELGQGATFKIYLPNAQQEAAVPAARAYPLDLPRGTETILLVEDDPALRDMATTLLRRLGYTVWPAADGIEALRIQKRRDVGHVDLLFTDVVMPNMNGRELAERVRALFPHTRTLFTSAFTENAIVHQGILDKSAALLQKPFTPSALAHKLREVFAAEPPRKLEKATDV